MTADEIFLASDFRGTGLRNDNLVMLSRRFNCDTRRSILRLEINQETSLADRNAQKSQITEYLG